MMIAYDNIYLSVFFTVLRVLEGSDYE